MGNGKIKKTVLSDQQVKAPFLFLNGRDRDVLVLADWAWKNSNLPGCFTIRLLKTASVIRAALTSVTQIG